MRSYCQDIAPYPQPQPARNPSGDCFACALVAAMRFLFGDRAPDFDACYERFSVVTTSGSLTLSNTWPAMYQALDRDPELEAEVEIVAPTYKPTRWSHPWFIGGVHKEYARRLEGYLRSEWVVFTEINFAGLGPSDGSGRHHSIDHFVLIDGIREFWKRCELESGTRYGALMRELHVVCSARGAYWTEMDDFLWRHGAAGWILCRRALVDDSD